MKNRDYFWGEKKQFLFTLTSRLRDFFEEKARSEKFFPPERELKKFWTFESFLRSKKFP